MTTAQDIFDIVMGLMDEVADNGNTNTSDTAEYKNRTLFILNDLRGEVFPYSDTYKTRKAGKRPVCPLITDFTTPIGLDDYICQSVLTNGLAARLLLDENPTAANYYQQVYEERMRDLRAGIGMAAESEDIVDVYGFGGTNANGNKGRWPYEEETRW